VTRRTHTTVETLLARDPAARRAVAKIRKLDRVIVAASRRFLAAVVQQGRELERLKARLDYGDWLRVLRKKYPWSVDTAENRIAISRYVSQHGGVRKFRNLPLTALAMMARKGAPEQARIALIERSAAGEKISLTEVRRSLRYSSSELPESKEAVRAALFPNAPAKPVPMLPTPAPSPPAARVEVISPTVANLAAVREMREAVDNVLVAAAWLSTTLNALVGELQHLPADNRTALFMALDKLQIDIVRLRETHTIGGRSCNE
jgi:hypothetical protein